MDKRKVRKFKNQQKRLAKKIAVAHESANFTINYEQKLPKVYTDWEKEKLIVRDKGQYIFQAIPIRKGKHRLIVIMCFHGVCDRRKVGKILRRHFWIRYIEDGFEIISSFNPHTIAKF